MSAVACDLDETVVTTRAALRFAYAAAGVQWEPTTRPWQEWCTAKQHDVKGQYYPEAVARYARVLPIGRYADANDWLILTGASAGAVDTLRRMLGLRLRHCITGLTIDQKIAAIRAHNVRLYFDDDSETVKRINLEVKECCAILIQWPR